MTGRQVTTGCFFLLAAASACELLSGCAPRKRTEVMLEIATDLTAPVPLKSVHIDVVRLPEMVTVAQQELIISGVTGQGDRLPATFGVYSERSESYRLRVTLTAFDNNGRELVTRRAALNLQQERTIFLRLGLVSACVGKSDCSEGSTCIEGRCGHELIDARLLPDYTPALKERPACESGTQFKDTSTGLAIPGTTVPCTTNAGCHEGVCYRLPDETNGVMPDAGPGSGGRSGSGGSGVDAPMEAGAGGARSDVADDSSDGASGDYGGDDGEPDASDGADAPAAVNRPNQADLGSPCPVRPAGCANGAGTFCESSTTVATCVLDGQGCVLLAQERATCPSEKPCTGTHPMATCSCVTPPAACAAGAGTSCHDSRLVTCGLDSAGCLAIKKTEDCPSNRSCSGMAPNAACVCPAGCTPGSKSCGPGGGIRTCNTDSGCPAWGPEVPCQGVQTCHDGGGVPSCECPARPEGCEKGAGTFCASAMSVATCVADAQGCIALANPTPCPTGKPCSGAHPTASCSCGAPPSACAAGAGSACQGNTLVTCGLDGDSCLAVTRSSPCGASQTCKGTAPNAACVCPAPPTDCGTAGSVCRASNVLATCEPNSDGCLITTAAAACPGNKVCTGFHPGATCACPAPPPGCMGQATGSFCQSPSLLVTCGSDSDGCTVAKASESCAHGCAGNYPGAACCVRACAGKCGGSDGCGGTCPDTCVAPETCGGNGVANVCGQPHHTLTVEVRGMGSVTSTEPVAGINCNRDPNSSDCTESYVEGTAVTLQAGEVPDHLLDVTRFAGWLPGCSNMGHTAKVTMNQDIRCVALYDPRLSVTIYGGGSVMGSDGAFCDASVVNFQRCERFVPVQTDIILTATAAPGFIFEGWNCEANALISGNVVVVNLSTASTCYVRFTPMSDL